MGAVASPRERTYAFPSIGLDVSLSMQVPLRNIKSTDGTHVSVDKSRFRSGMALWDASFVLAEFMSRHCDLAQVAEVQELMNESGTIWNTWKGKRGVEIGAGLGLPS